MKYILFSTQRLTGATLLVFANKQDLPGALKAEEIKQVRKNISVKIGTTIVSDSLFHFCEWGLIPVMLS